MTLAVKRPAFTKQIAKASEAERKAASEAETAVRKQQEADRQLAIARQKTLQLAEKERERTAVLALLENTWIKKKKYEFVELLSTQPVEHPRLKAQYEQYKASISVDGIVDGNETQLFHGCDEAAIRALCKLVF